MVTDSFFSLACAGVIGILFGLALSVAGYRLFMVLIPIWGFFFGLALGAQTMQALFGVGFLATVSSWVVGFLVGGVFALLSYFFYILAVALIGGSLGYAVVVGLLMAIGLDMGVLVWLIGIVAAVVMAFVTIRFNLAKWVIIIATSVLGAGTIVGAIIGMFYPFADVLANPVRLLLSSSLLTTLLFIAVVVMGIIIQVRSNQAFELTEYDRWSGAPS